MNTTPDVGSTLYISNRLDAVDEKNVVVLTGDTFQAEIEKNDLTLVEFYAPCMRTTTSDAVTNLPQGVVTARRWHQSTPKLPMSCRD